MIEGRSDVFFIALNTAINCSAVTPGMWDGKETNCGTKSATPGMWGREVTRKEQRNEIKEVKGITGKRFYHPGRV